MYAFKRHDFLEKINRIRAYLEAHHYTGMILARRDNFSWLTGGADSAIIETTEYGFCTITITADKVYLVAQSMDAFWLMDQVFEGSSEIEPVILKWHEKSREEKSIELAGKYAVCDRDLAGCDFRLKDIIKLHYPLTSDDLTQYREWGKEYEKTLAKIVSGISPGMTELDIRQMGITEYLKAGASPTIFLVGSDENLNRYRHPVPSAKPVRKKVLIHPGMRKNGQHCLITRMFTFGEPDEQFRRDYDFLNMLQAQTLSMCEPGARLGDIIEARKQLVYDSGYGDEWEKHYPGGFTEYYVGTAQWGIDNEPILETMCLDWYLTVTGAKVEELALVTGGGVELLSVNGYWPVKRYSYGGKSFDLPDILVM